MIIANDATVKAGAFFPMTAKKVLRAQHIAMDNHIPTLYLVDSAGVFLPLQEDVFPDQDDFGRVFRNNAVMSCARHSADDRHHGHVRCRGAYLPVMTDHVLMTEGADYSWLDHHWCRRPSVRKFPLRSWAGASMHAEISGTVDFKEANDAVCIARLRSLVDATRACRASPIRSALAYDEVEWTLQNIPRKTCLASSTRIPRR